MLSSGVRSESKDASLRRSSFTGRLIKTCTSTQCFACKYLVHLLAREGVPVCDLPIRSH